MIYFAVIDRCWEKAETSYQQSSADGTVDDVE